MTFQPASDVASNALFARDAGYFDMLDDFVQGERVDAVDPYMHGVLAAIGIAKGRPFTPNDRQRELLDAASRMERAATSAPCLGRGPLRASSNNSGETHAEERPVLVTIRSVVRGHATSVRCVA
jgi:hypothetical protein